MKHLLLIALLLLSPVLSMAGGSHRLHLPLVARPAEDTPLPPRNLDPRLDALGVTIEDAAVQSGGSYWRVVEILWLDEAQANGGHSLRWNILAEDGARIIGQAARVTWASGSATVLTEDKPPPEYSANFPMYAASCSYSLAVDGLASDSIHCLGLGTPEQPLFTIHTEFLIVYQRVVAP